MAPPPPQFLLFSLVFSCSSLIFDAIVYIYSLFHRTLDIVKEIDPQLPTASEDYPSLVIYEPLPFLGSGPKIDWVGLVLQSYPMRSYCYLDNRPLPPCDHPQNGLRLGPRITLRIKAILHPSFSWAFARI